MYIYADCVLWQWNDLNCTAMIICTLRHLIWRSSLTLFCIYKKSLACRTTNQPTGSFIFIVNVCLHFYFDSTHFFGNIRYIHFYTYISLAEKQPISKFGEKKIRKNCRKFHIFPLVRYTMQFFDSISMNWNWNKKKTRRFQNRKKQHRLAYGNSILIKANLDRDWSTHLVALIEL